MAVLLVSSAATAEVAVTRASGRVFLSGPQNEVAAEMKDLADYKKRFDRIAVAIPALSPTKTEITPLLTSQIQKLDDKHWLDGVGGFGNCHGEAAYFAGYTPILGHDESGLQISSARRSTENIPGAPKACEKIPHSKVQPGDVGVFLDVEADGRSIHSFTMISKNLAFSKNGHNGLKVPYRVQTLSEVADTYFTVQNSENPADGETNHYRKQLSKGRDCVRGSEKQINDCIDAEAPFVAFFYRCKSLEQLETENKSVLTPEYFALKKVLWQELRSYVRDQTTVLNPRAFSATYTDTVYRIKVEEERLWDTTNGVSTFFWSQLSAVATEADRFLDPESEVRPAIFP